MKGEIAIYRPPRPGLPFVVAHVIGGKVTMLAATFDRADAHREAVKAGGGLTVLRGDDEPDELRKLPKLRARGHR